MASQIERQMLDYRARQEAKQTQSRIDLAVDNAISDLNVRVALNAELDATFAKFQNLYLTGSQS
jgi:hypothetical protein